MCDPCLGTFDSRTDIVPPRPQKSKTVKDKAWLEYQIAEALGFRRASPVQIKATHSSQQVNFSGVVFGPGLLETLLQEFFLTAARAERMWMFISHDHQMERQKHRSLKGESQANDRELLFSHNIIAVRYPSKREEKMISSWKERTHLEMCKTPGTQLGCGPTTLSRIIESL